MKKIRVSVKKRPLNGDNPTGAMHDWVLVCSDGSLPQEGYGHTTKKEARQAMLAMYDNETWGLKRGWIDPN